MAAHPHTTPSPSKPGTTGIPPEPPAQPPAAAVELSDEQLTTVVGGHQRPLMPCYLMPCLIIPCV